MTCAHIVTIRQAGAVVGYQVRTGRGAGQSTYFAAGKHGGPGPAQLAAVRHVKRLGLQVVGRRGGSAKGRLQRNSPTPAPGIRWSWHPYYGSAALHVHVSWSDKAGHGRHTHYSTALHGLGGALDLAMAKRRAAGAPLPDRDMLLRALRRAYREGPPA